MVLATSIAEEPGGQFVARPTWYDGNIVWRCPKTNVVSQNEYAKQIREYRSQEKAGKSHGKVFVRGEQLKLSIVHI
jgi:hypothetical protein